MSYSIQLSPRIKAQLLEISDLYRHFHPAAPDFAFEELLDSTLARIAENPFLKQVSGVQTDAGAKYRFATVWKYQCFYLVDEPARVVAFVAAYHATSNPAIRKSRLR